MAVAGDWHDVGAEVPLKVVVGLDLGSACSGFAYRHLAEVKRTHTFHDWPGRGRKPYCKTMSGVFYRTEELGNDDVGKSYAALEWGWPAHLTYLRELQLTSKPQGSFFVESFMLHEELGGKNFEQTECCVLPAGLPVERVVSDFLAGMADFIVEHLRSSYGKQLSRREIQWCLAVPAGWDESAKQKITASVQMAGMVEGPCCPPDRADQASPHPLKLVPEPEAAAVHCLLTTRNGVRPEPGTQILVVDVGSGTLDLTVYAFREWLKLAEVKQRSVGGLPSLERNVFQYLADRIPCLDDFLTENPSVRKDIQNRWEDIKFTFDGSEEWRSKEFEIPRKLANAWKRADDSRLGDFCSYDLLTITSQDLRHIFDPLLDQLLECIDGELGTAKGATLLLVGGLAGSPYVQKRVEEAFRCRVGSILVPADPGSAVCQGAVAMGASPESSVAPRVARRTYAAGIARFFQASDPPESLEVVGDYRYCKTALAIFMRKGEMVEAGKCISHRFRPVYLDQKEIVVELYSSEEQNPRYTTDEGVRLEGRVSVDISGDLVNQLRRHVLVSLHAGGPWIQVRVQRKDFGNTEEVIEMVEISDP